MLTCALNAFPQCVRALDMINAAGLVRSPYTRELIQVLVDEELLVDTVVLSTTAGVSWRIYCVTRRAYRDMRLKPGSREYVEFSV